MTSRLPRYERALSRRRGGDAEYTVDELIERAENEARKLPDYESDNEESTARHNIPPNIHFDVHLSQPDSDEPEIEIGPLKAKNLPTWAVVAIVATGVIAAAATAIASHFAAK
jgi:hypothetical protein